MIKPYGALLYHIPDEMVPDINMLGSVVEHRILSHTNPTLIITKYHSGI